MEKTIEADTIRLLRECDAGIKMGVEAIQEVEQYSSDPELRQFLKSNMAEHEKLQSELQELLDQYHDDGKDPNAMAKGMSWLKTNIKLAVDESDKTIADLITDGCNMGVKSLNRYLNQYAAPGPCRSKRQAPGFLSQTYLSPEGSNPPRRIGIPVSRSPKGK